MKITLKQLRKLGACAGQVDLFKATFGEGVELTEANVLEHGAKFYLSWIAWKIFSATIYAEYKKARATIDAEYQKACAPIYAKYQKACDTIFWQCVKMMEKI
jgi:hypothetical protein